MISVSQAVRDEFLSPAQKNLRLKFSDNTTLENNSIISESMSLEQSICDEEQIRFGAVNSACFKVDITGTAKRYKGLKVVPTIYTESGGVTLGEFTIIEDELSDNREYRSLTAYDALYDIFEKNMSTWYTNLNLPMTMKQFRDSFFSNIGITQENETLPNDDMQVQRTVSTGDAVLSGQKILESICEINGCFGMMVWSPSANKGVFRYVFIKGDEALYPRNNLYPNDSLFPHQGDMCFLDSGDILSGGLVYQEYTSLPIARVQLRNNVNDVGVVYPNVSTGNGYQVTDNFLIYGKNNAELTTVANKLYNKVKDISYVPTKATMRGRPWQELGDKVVVTTNRTSITFPILHRMLSGITALKDEFEAKGKENYTYNINSQKSQLQQIRQKTLEIVTTVDELSTTMTESVTELGVRVESYRSQFQQTAQQIQTTVEAHYSEQTAFKSQITQRADSISSSVTSLSNNVTNFQSQITQRAEGIETRVTATESGLSGVQSSMTQMQSTITQTASEIRAEVSSATTHAAIVAKINDNTSSVKIQADKVDISGFVTFTDLSTAGRTAINGSNITTGTIKDINSNVVWNLETGKLEATKLSITTPNFTLSENGSITAKNAAIKGTFETTDYNGDAIKIQGNTITGLSNYWNGQYGNQTKEFIKIESMVDSAAISSAGDIYILSPFRVKDTFNINQGYTKAISGEYTIRDYYSDSSTSYTYRYRTLRFVNGLLLSDTIVYSPP